MLMDIKKAGHPALFFFTASWSDIAIFLSEKLRDFEFASRCG